MSRNRHRARVSAIAHGVAVAAVLVAMSPWGGRGAARPHVVVAIDVSASVVESGAMPAADAFAARLRDADPRTTVDLLAFAATVRGWAIGETPATLAAVLGRAAPAIDPWATVPAIALAAAGARGAAEPSSVVLVSDGDGIDDAALAAARALHAAGHTLYTVPVVRRTRPSRPFIAAVDAPLRVAPGAPVTLEVTIAQAGEGGESVPVVASERDGESRRTDVAVGAGVPATVALTFAGHAGSGLRSFEIAIGNDASDAARRASIEVAIGDPLRVGSLGPPPVWLSRLGAGFAVDRVDDPAAAVDVLVVPGLAVGPAPLDRTTAAKVVATVRDGVGLLAVAGAIGFGPGGWRGSALESALPVRIERAGPDADVTFLLDRSGSVAAGDRWPAAAGATVSVLATLGERDRVRIVTFAGGATEALAWRAAAGAVPDAIAALGAVRPGGPTNLAAALDAVAFPADGAAPRRRLLIVLSDGRLPEAASRYRAVGVRLRDQGIRVGAVQSVDGEPAPGLRALTLDGANGRVAVAGRDDLAAAFRAAVADGWWLDDPGVPATAAASPAPPAGGWPAPRRVSRTRLAETGTAVATTGVTGDVPVLATGRHGLGRIAVAAFDPAGSAWAGGEPWRPILHWLGGGAEARRPAGRIVVGRNRGEVELHVPPGSALGAAWRVQWGDRTAWLDPAGPGRRRAEVDVPSVGPRTAAWAMPVGSPARRVPLPVVAVPGAELMPRGVDAPALERLAAAGGGCLLDRDDRIPTVGGRGDGPRWGWIAFALFAFLVGRAVKFASASGR